MSLARPLTLGLAALVLSLPAGARAQVMRGDPGAAPTDTAAAGVFDFTGREYAVVNDKGLKFRVWPAVKLERGPGGAAKLTLVALHSEIDPSAGVQVGDRHFAMGAFDGELERAVQGARVTAATIGFTVETPGRPLCERLSIQQWRVGASWIFQDCRVERDSRVIRYSVPSQNAARATLPKDLKKVVRELEAAGRTP